MDVIAAIKERRSIRGFKKDQVPRDIIETILKTATHCPSGMNAQPWEFAVVTGTAMEKLRQENINNFLSDKNTKVVNEKYIGIYRQRQVEIARQVLDAMNIKREDKEARSAWHQYGFRYFDAPAVIIITTDASLDERWSFFGVGSISQTICLIALSYGLGTCISLQGVYYSDGVKKVLNIPDNKTCVTSISLGYPDWEFPANNVVSKRESIENITAWYGFE
jgi:nitroreductase